MRCGKDVAFRSIKRSGLEVMLEVGKGLLERDEAALNALGSKDCVFESSR